MQYLRAILFAVAASIACAARAAPVNTGHVQLELSPAAMSIAPGSTLHVALHQKIAPGWHTYWRNPGDAGEPPKIGWTLPQDWRAGEIAWPAPPVRLPVGPLMDYGYKGEVYLPIPITAAAAAASGSTARLKADVSLLVCKDICIPEDATLTLDLPVSRSAASPDPAVAAALASIPKASGLTATMALQGSRLAIAVLGPALKGPGVREAYFFPYDSTVIKHASPQRVERGAGGLTLSVEPGYAFSHGKPPASLSGVLAVDGRPYEITAAVGSLPAGARGMGQASSGPGHAEAGGLGAPLAAGFAFLGGLILNLMPCVFPILSMKALALAKHGAGRPRAHGLAFLVGVMGTFVGLAAALLAAKAAGAAVGWGFQLQSPAVVAGLCLLMLLIGLNLSGVFEAGLSLQGAASNAGGGGLIGSALTGALAVVVAAPCTAPFMAGAIAYALTQTEWVSLSIFAALGLGFATPFLILSFAPGLLRRLPRPGPWMDGLKKVLAFPMYGAAAWLLWVLTLQAGSTALAALLASGVVLALAAWIYGSAQRAQAGGSRFALLYGLSLVAVLGAAGLAAVGLSAPGSTAQAAAPGSPGAALPTEPFSPGRVAELQAGHKPVFVDFTAAWCITCQVNEKVALSSPKVAAAFARVGAVYLKADWTKRDPVIAQVLTDHGRAGVPLYLMYGAKGGEPVVLPQLLTEGAVLDALKKAAAS